MAEVAALARLQGAVVASSQCFGTSGRLALAPVADWLRNPAVQVGDGDPRPGLARRGRAGWCPAEGRGGRGGRLAGRWRTPGSATGSSRAWPGRCSPSAARLLLVLDNMQWCDQETLAFLTFCLGLAPTAPAPGGRRRCATTASTTTRSWRAGPVRMRATGLLTELSLSPLEAADTARLAEAISGRPLPRGRRGPAAGDHGRLPAVRHRGRARHRRSRAATPLPAGDLAAVLRNRLEQATPAAREVAGLAAAVGTDFTLDLLTEASDLDADVVVEAVDELWRRRIMREFGDGYDFSHDLLRETAYAQVSPPKRWLLHRRIAQGLELLHADDTDAVAAQLAEQYARGGRPGGRWPTTGGPPRSRRAMFAHAEAIRLHKEALSIVAAMPAGRDRDSQELAVLEAMAAPLNARYGYSSRTCSRRCERSIALAESLGRKDSTVAGLVALLGVAVRPGAHRRRLPDGHPRAGPGRPRLRAERPGPLRASAGRPSAWACPRRDCVTWSSPPSWRAAPSR